MGHGGLPPASVSPFFVPFVSATCVVKLVVLRRALEVTVMDEVATVEFHLSALLGVVHATQLLR